MLCSILFAFPTSDLRGFICAVLLFLLVRSAHRHRPRHLEKPADSSARRGHVGPRQRMRESGEFLQQQCRLWWPGHSGRPRPAAEAKAVSICLCRKVVNASMERVQLKR